MRVLRALMLIVLLLCVVDAAVAADAKGVRVKVVLTDGSQLQGATKAMVPAAFVAPYGRMELDLAKAKQIAFTPGKESVQLTMQNGDTLTGFLSLADFEMDTVLGKVTVPLRHVVRIEVAVKAKK